MPNLPRALKIAGGFVIAVVVVFGLLWTKNQVSPARPKPRISAELIEATKKMAALHDKALKHVAGRITVADFQLRGIAGTKRLINSHSGALDRDQRGRLQETLTSLESEWTNLRAEDVLLNSELQQLQNVIRGLQLGQSRQELADILSQLTDGIEMQKTQFSLMDLSLSSMAAKIQLLNASLHTIKDTDLVSELRGMGLSAGTAIQFNQDQKTDVLADEVSVRALKKVVNSLPLL